MQKSYKQLSKKTGLSERAIKDAIVYLEKKGIIKRVFRNIYYEKRAVTLSNVMYIVLNVHKLIEITFPTLDCEKKEYMPKIRQRGIEKKRYVSLKKVEVCTNLYIRIQRLLHRTYQRLLSLWKKRILI